MEWTVFVLGAIVVGLVQVVKTTELISSKFMPIVALFLGLIIAFVGGDLIGIVALSEKVLAGLILGLMSVGLYSGVKSVGEGIQHNG